MHTLVSVLTSLSSENTYCILGSFLYLCIYVCTPLDLLSVPPGLSEGMDFSSPSEGDIANPAKPSPQIVDISELLSGGTLDWIEGQEEEEEEGEGEEEEEEEEEGEADDKGVSEAAKTAFFLLSLQLYFLILYLGPQCLCSRINLFPEQTAAV